MPYEIRQRGSRYCVYKQGSEDPIACHDTREECERQMRALYASEGERKDLGDQLIYFGGEVKALGGGKVGGYLITFSTERDPDQSEHRDFFDGETDYDLDDGAGKASVYYAHGQDETLRKRRLAKGAVKQDEVGVWIEAQLSLRDEYESAIYELAKKNKLGWSSGSVTHLVDREPVKDEGGKVIAHRVLHWPIAEASLTPTPAEPRCGAMALKSFAVPALKELAAEPARPSLAELTERWLDTGSELLARYQQVAGAEAKVGRKLSTARRERLQQARQLIDDLLLETDVVRDEPATEEAAPTKAAEADEAPTAMDTPEPARDVAAPDPEALALTHEFQSLSVQLAGLGIG